MNTWKWNPESRYGPPGMTDLYELLPGVDEKQPIPKKDPSAPGNLWDTEYVLELSRWIGYVKSKIPKSWIKPDGKIDNDLVLDYINSHNLLKYKLRFCLSCGRIIKKNKNRKYCYICKNPEPTAKKEYEKLEQEDLNSFTSSQPIVIGTISYNYPEIRIDLDELLDELYSYDPKPDEIFYRILRKDMELLIYAAKDFYIKRSGRKELIFDKPLSFPFSDEKLFGKIDNIDEWNAYWIDHLESQLAKIAPNFEDLILMLPMKVYRKKCSCCGKIFLTIKPKQKLHPECLKEHKHDYNREYAKQGKLKTRRYHLTIEEKLKTEIKFGKIDSYERTNKVGTTDISPHSNIDWRPKTIEKEYQIIQNELKKMGLR